MRQSPPQLYKYSLFLSATTPGEVKTDLPRLPGGLNGSSFFFFMIQLYKYHSWNVILSLLFSKFFFFYVIYDNYFVIIVVIICYQVVPITWNIELNKTWCFVQRTSCRHFGLKCFQEDRDGRPEKRIITSSPCLLLLCKGALLYTMQVIFLFLPLTHTHKYLASLSWK